MKADQVIRCLDRKLLYKQFLLIFKNKYLYRHRRGIALVYANKKNQYLKKWVYIFLKTATFRYDGHATTFSHARKKSKFVINFLLF